MIRDILFLGTKSYKQITVSKIARATEQGYINYYKQNTIKGSRLDLAGKIKRLNTVLEEIKTISVQNYKYIIENFNIEKYIQSIPSYNTDRRNKNDKNMSICDRYAIYTQYTF